SCMTFRFNDSRHHFASWFVIRGGSLQALKEILGHADLKMALRYAHLAPDHLRREIARTDRPRLALMGAGPAATPVGLAGRSSARGGTLGLVRVSVGAEGGTRAPTPLRAHDPESCASANSATSARAGISSYGPGQ